MKTFFQKNAVFLGLSLMLVVALGLAILYIPQGELHLLLCNRHTPARDIFYKYYTQVAEWFPYVVCVSLLIFSRIGDGVFATSAMTLSALSTQILKHICNALRPVTWFDLFIVLFACKYAVGCLKSLSKILKCFFFIQLLLVGTHYDIATAVVAFHDKLLRQLVPIYLIHRVPLAYERDKAIFLRQALKC